MSGLTNGEVSVFGGGLYADVTGNTQVTINTGKYNHIYGSGYVESPYNPAHIGGDVTVTFNDGETQILGAINDQIAGALDGVVAGSMNIVIKEVRSRLAFSLGTELLFQRMSTKAVR